MTGYRRFLVYAALLFLTAMLGCSSNGLSTLTGVVTIDGQPAANVGLQFQPTGENGSPSTAMTDVDGRYEAEFSFTTKGIQPGEHSVRVMSQGPSGDPRKMKKEPSRVAARYYNEVEKITITSGRNTHDFDLMSK